MLTRLLPEQISGFWPKIKMRIASTLPEYENSEGDLLGVLNNLLIGKMDCWVVISDYDAQGNRGIIGFVITQIVETPGGTKNLLIYCVWTDGSMSYSIWTDGVRTLSDFARKNGCRGIVGYSNQEDMLTLSSRVGADVSHRLIVYSL